MWPTLFSLRLGENELGLHTYGISVAVGFAIGLLLFWREGRRQGLDGGRLLDLSFWTIVVGLVGSRVAFVALNAREFAQACFGRELGAAGRLSGCSAVLRFWEGGLVYYGGVLASGLVVVMFCRREGWSFWRVGDAAAPTLAIGHVLGRWGCFFAGCCYGKACPTSLGVTFPPSSVAFQELHAVGVIGPTASTTPPLHPTQLYEAFGELGIFLLLLGLRRRWRADDSTTGAATPRGEQAGRLLFTYAVCYACLRFVVEIFRGDATRRYIFEWHFPRVAPALALPPDQPLLFSVSQLVSVVVFVAAIAVAVVVAARRVAVSRPRGA